MRALAGAGLVLAAALAATPAGAVRLAREDGAGWVEPGKLGGHPAVLLFWDAECAPCLAELANLSALRAQLPDAQLVAVSLSPREASRRALARYAPNLQALRATAPPDPRGLLAALGDPRGALPFHAAFDGDGRPCHAAVGALTPSIMTEVARACLDATPRTL